MKHYYQLVIDEIERASHYYLTLLLGFFTLQTLVILYKLVMSKQKLALHDVFDNSSFYMLLVGGAVIGLLIYSVYMWWVEWRGKHHNIYQLLLLPGNRMAIPLAKITTILLLIFALLGLQIIYMMGINALLGKLFTNYYPRPFMSEWLQTMYFTEVFIPQSLQQFVLRYGLGSFFLFGISNLMMFLLSEARMNKILRFFLATCYSLLIFAFIFFSIRYSNYYIFLGMEEWLYTFVVVGIGLGIQFVICRYLVRHWLSI